MAFVSASSSKFFIADSASTSQDISAYVTRVEGLPGKKDFVDVTTFGSVGHRLAPSLENAEFTLDVLYSEDATTGATAIFNTMRSSTIVKAFQFWPNGTTAKSISGNCWLDDPNYKAQVGDYVRATLHFKADNGITAQS